VSELAWHTQAACSREFEACLAAVQHRSSCASGRRRGMTEDLEEVGEVLMRPWALLGQEDPRPCFRQNATDEVAT
jgi:hypothetical protein